MRNGANIDAGRRRFLKQAGILALMSACWGACRDTIRKWTARFSGAPVALGHRLLKRDFPPASREKRVKILVVGGGITGLSACRRLQQKGESDFLLLELDQQAGGNSRSDSNEYTAYPLGAHYLPVPNRHDEDLIAFLQEEGIITGFDAQNNPVYQETMLCEAPQSRLYIHQHWQEGLLPQYGVPEASQAAMKAFYQKMETFKEMRGADGKYLFDLPLKNCSNDPSFTRLDRISMAKWLQQEGFTAPELLEHLRYCCLDDFGVGLERVSAWAGIHYFTARKSPQDNVLTWPEGNGFLVKCLQRHAADRILTGHMAFEVIPDDAGVKVMVYDAAANETIAIRADKLILATPQFVNQRLLADYKIDLSGFHYAPWLVATLTLNDFIPGAGAAFSWDNVLFEAEGLGYVNAQHQSVAQTHARQVITYYCAFDGPDPLALRRRLYENDESYWQRFIFNDLKKAHPRIEDWTESMVIQRWGHGMISPVTGFLSGAALAGARSFYHPRIVLAHSDLSGMSLFEEAFHQGLMAADKCLG